MSEDPFVEEVRAVRSKHAAKFNNNLRRIFDDLRKSQRSSRRKTVNRQPKLRLKAAG